MRGKSHLVSGLISGSVSTTALIMQGSPLKSIPVVLVSAALGSLLPDIDLPKSTIGKLTRPVSTIINKMFGHRTITHTWLLLFIYYLLISKYSDNDCVKFMVVGLWVGFINHLMCDFMTVKGIPLAYPFTHKTIHLTKCKSGEHDYFLMIPVNLFWCLAVCIWIHREFVISLAENLLPIN